MLARTSALDAAGCARGGCPAIRRRSSPGPGSEAASRSWRGVSGELAFATELIVSELVTNAVRYGARPVVLRLMRGASLVCEVSDGSSTAPHLRRARVVRRGRARAAAGRADRGAVGEPADGHREDDLGGAAVAGLSSLNHPAGAPG
ncbi:hypothetical protein [Streptomyces shaanxiensis]